MPNFSTEWSLTDVSLQLLAAATSIKCDKPCYVASNEKFTYN